MMNAIALDDEPIALEVIRQFAGMSTIVNLAQSFTNPFEALNYLKENQTDLVFLDIRMPDISGIAWAQQLPYPVMIVFTTAYSEHALESFELDAIDYLLKPFSQERFMKAVSKAAQLLQLKRQETANGHLFIRTGHDQLKLMLSDILYIKSAGNYVQFITAKEKILSRLTMAEAEALLPHSSFVRVHRSYIVPVGRIRKIEKTQLWLEDQPIPVANGYLESLQKRVR